jgi:hypothetical protein
MVRNTFISALVGALLALVPMSAMSAILTFNLKDVVFEDGSQAIGFFQFAGTWDIQVHGGMLPAFEYTPDNSAVLPVEDPFGYTMFLGAANDHRSIKLHFPRVGNGTPPPGSLIALVTGDQFNGSKEFGDPAPRGVTGGSVLVTSPGAVPEPSAALFTLLLMMAGAAFITARRRLAVRSTRR